MVVWCAAFLILFVRSLETTWFADRWDTAWWRCQIFGSVILYTPTLHHPRCPCVKNLLHFPWCCFLSSSFYPMLQGLLFSVSPCHNLSPSLLSVWLCRSRNWDALGLGPNDILWSHMSHTWVMQQCENPVMQSQTFDICVGKDFFLAPFVTVFRTKRSASLCLESPDGLWLSSSHAPIPQSDWSQTVLTENPSLCACLLVCVCLWAVVCVEREEDASGWQLNWMPGPTRPRDHNERDEDKTLQAVEERCWRWAQRWHMDRQLVGVCV